MIPSLWRKVIWRWVFHTFLGFSNTPSPSSTLWWFSWLQHTFMNQCCLLVLLATRPLVKAWAIHTNQEEKLINVHLCSETENTDLVGELRPCSFKEMLLHLPLLIDECTRRYQSLCGDPENQKQEERDNVRVVKGKCDQLTERVKKVLDHISFLQTETDSSQKKTRRKKTKRNRNNKTSERN